jgi:hypothetical protein
VYLRYYTVTDLVPLSVDHAEKVGVEEAGPCPAVDVRVDSGGVVVAVVAKKINPVLENLGTVRCGVCICC